MSRCYRVRQTVRVKDSIDRDIRACDEICTELEILGILPPEQMTELMRVALRNRGFEAEDDGRMVRRENGLEVRVNPETGEVSIRLEQSESVHVEGKKETSVYGNPTEQQREDLQRRLREELEQQASRETEGLQRQVSEALEAALGEVGRELEQVVNEVTREALKQKAAQLGNIKELSEDPEAGSLTIKVEV